MIIDHRKYAIYIWKLHQNQNIDRFIKAGLFARNWSNYVNINNVQRALKTLSLLLLSLSVSSHSLNARNYIQNQSLFERSRAHIEHVTLSLSQWLRSTRLFNSCRSNAKAKRNHRSYISSIILAASFGTRHIIHHYCKPTNVLINQFFLESAAQEVGSLFDARSLNDFEFETKSGRSFGLEFRSDFNERHFGQEREVRLRRFKKKINVI